MTNTVISMREMQRNYSKVIRQARVSRRPVYLSSRGKPEAVLLDVDSYTSLQATHDERHNARDWATIKKKLRHIRSQGKQHVNLSKFIHADRKRHVGT